jgi:hypothetical protein
MNKPIMIEAETENNKFLIGASVTGRVKHPNKVTANQKNTILRFVSYRIIKNGIIQIRREAL